MNSLRDELYELCLKGAKQVRAGQYDALKFDLFNLEEAILVRQIMKEHFPDIQYIRKWVAGGPDNYE